MTDLVSVTNPRRWSAMEIPMPTGSGAAKGAFLSGQEAFVLGLAKRSLNESLHIWRPELKRPTKLPLGPPAKHCVSGKTGRGFCGSIALGGRHVPAEWLDEGTALVELAIEDGAEGAALHGAANEIVGELSTTDGATRAVRWLSDGGMHWLGPEQVESSATGTDGSTQVGSVRWRGGCLDFACLWHGTHDSLIDLHPEEYLVSAANGVDGNCQFGCGGVANAEGGIATYHPLLWHGTKASAVDLMPPGFMGGSIAAGTRQIQVGEVWSKVNSNDTPMDSRACFWTGTADTFSDLHEFLPDGFVKSMACDARILDQRLSVLGTAWLADNGDGMALMARPILWACEL